MYVNNCRQERISRVFSFSSLFSFSSWVNQKPGRTYWMRSKHLAILFYVLVYPTERWCPTTPAHTIHEKLSPFSLQSLGNSWETDRGIKKSHETLSHVLGKVISILLPYSSKKRLRTLRTATKKKIESRYQ